MAHALAVFDLDGTLIDTAPDLIETCNHVLTSHGLPAQGPSVLEPCIGYGARAMIHMALKTIGAPVSEADLDAMLDEFVDHYKTRMTKLSRPFPEMSAALDALEAAGVAIAVCTNKREDLARPLLDDLSILSRLVALTGGNTFSVSKPHPDHLLKTIALADGTPENTVFVGDSRVDRETAQRAKVPFVGVTYGYSDTPMADLSPEILCGPGEDVADAITTLMGTRV